MRVACNAESGCDTGRRTKGNAQWNLAVGSITSKSIVGSRRVATPGPVCFELFGMEGIVCSKKGKCG